MRNLEEIQRWMQAVIMHIDGVPAGIASDQAQDVIVVNPDEADAVITRSKALTSQERLEIYNRAYYARLLECLREEFPILVKAVGEEAFDQFALGYLQSYPSRSYTLNRLALDFPRYLQETKPSNRGRTKNWPDFVIDLATLELTYNEVFDGPGVENQSLLKADDIRAISPEQFALVRLIPVCCLRLLALRFPVATYYRAAKAGKAPAVPRPRPTWLAITRRNYVVRRYSLTKTQFTLLNRLAHGSTLSDAIGLTVELCSPKMNEFVNQLQEWFRNWTAEGFFQKLGLSSESNPR